MGILGDIIANRIDKIVNDRRQEKAQPQVYETQDIEMYNRIWLDKVVHETGFALTDNEKRITNINIQINICSIFLHICFFIFILLSYYFKFFNIN